MKNRAKPETLRTMKKIEPYIWLLPSILMMGCMIMIPIFNVFRASVTEISKVGVYKEFNGFANYISVFKKQTFWHTLQNTVVWTIVVVGLSTLIGFVLALVLNVEFHGRKLVRAVIVFPWATALIIQSVVWKYIINADYGALNALLYNLGIIDHYVNWTATPGAFFAWECFVGIFVTVPFVTFCVLSGLQSIDASLYEACKVDGASFWAQLFKVTVPLVMPSLCSIPSPLSGQFPRAIPLTRPTLWSPICMTCPSATASSAKRRQFLSSVF